MPMFFSSFGSRLPVGFSFSIAMVGVISCSIRSSIIFIDFMRFMVASSSVSSITFFDIVMPDTELFQSRME